MAKKKKKNKIKKRPTKKRRVKIKKKSSRKLRKKKRIKKKIPKKRKILKNISLNKKNEKSSSTELIFKTKQEWIKNSLANKSCISFSLPEKALVIKLSVSVPANCGGILQAVPPIMTPPLLLPAPAIGLYSYPMMHYHKQYYLTLLLHWLQPHILLRYYELQ